MPSHRVRHLAINAAGVVVSSILLVSAAVPAHAIAHRIRIVRPGESIQQAVDSARPGDMIQLLPGTYHGSVLIKTSDLTLRGSGSATVIVPATGAGQAGTAGAAKPAAAGAHDSAADPAGGTCAAPGHGVCVLGTTEHPVTGVVIESLAVSGFSKNGVSGSGTDRMTVRDVLVEHNGEEGISQEKSTRGLLIDDHASDNGQAGIFVTNIAYGKGGAMDTEGTVIAGNTMTGNRFGADLRRVRNLTFENNLVTGNCSGVFVVGDDGVPRGGALTLRDNRVSANNKYCPADGRLPYLQGVGIVLTGVEDTVLTGNRIEGNVGASPMSGGVVLFRSFRGGPDARNSVTDNYVVDNAPADVADRDGGPGNTFNGNTYRTFELAAQAC